MQTQVIRWGNSQGIRISKAVMEEMGISVNEPLQMTVERGKITIIKPIAHQTLDERAAKYGGKLGDYTEYDWGEPVGREVW